jgi:hypothetical protein
MSDREDFQIKLIMFLTLKSQTCKSIAELQQALNEFDEMVRKYDKKQKQKKTNNQTKN